ncbi:MAG: hypothetical protein ABIO92_10170, partial [Chloroflexia bacterium]
SSAGFALLLLLPGILFTHAGALTSRVAAGIAGGSHTTAQTPTCKCALRLERAGVARLSFGTILNLSGLVLIGPAT